MSSSDVEVTQDDYYQVADQQYCCVGSKAGENGETAQQFVSWKEL